MAETQDLFESFEPRAEDYLVRFLKPRSKSNASGHAGYQRRMAFIRHRALMERLKRFRRTHRGDEAAGDLVYLVLARDRLQTKGARSKPVVGEGRVATELYRRAAELVPNADWQILEQSFVKALPPGQELSRALLDSLIRAAARALGQPDEVAAGPSAEVSAVESTDPLQAARDRGKHWATQEWNDPANLTLNDAANYAGRSDRMINEERQAGRLYALLPMGKMRGYRYPQWQFDAEPDRLAAALEPFNRHGASCWVIHNFMKRPSEALAGLTPQAWILDSTRPIDQVVRLAQARYDRDQGAQ